jgi:hypothetical protein
MLTFFFFRGTRLSTDGIDILFISTSHPFLVALLIERPAM